MSERMKRREFITLLGGAAFALPLSARAQQRPMPLIGSLNSASPVGWMNYMAGFRRGLGEIGYVEHQNVAIEYRWAEGLFDRLPAMAADLAERKVDVFFASGGIVSIQAAMAATKTIPIVFTTGVDPVSSGFVASLGHPGQNVTGVSLLSTELAGKRLEVLSELVPKARIFALLSNPKNPSDKSDLKGVEDAATKRGYLLHVLNAEQRAISMSPSRQPSTKPPTRFSSVPSRSSTVVAIGSSRCRRDGRSRRFIPGANIRSAAG